MAYALIKGDGSIEATLSKNVTGVTRFPTGIACIGLSVTAQTAIATADIVINQPVIAQAYVPHDNAASLSGCPDGQGYAVRTMLPSGAGVDAAFYVVFF